MDIQLHYTERGSGFPLVLLHGNGEDSSYFIHQLEYFSRYYRVIALDTRGHGKSPRGTADFTITQFAEDLLNFLDVHHISKAHFLGFSDGGNIALTFALKHPERVDHLILNGANLNPRGVKPLVQFPIEIRYCLASLFSNAYARSHAELLGLMVNEPNFTPDHLKTLTVPTLVIAGNRDMIKNSHTRTIAANLPNGRLVILPGDHFIANKIPYDFNRAVLSFLQSTST